MAQTKEEQVLSHRRAVAEYDKQNSMIISLKFNKNTEKDLIDALPPPEKSGKGGKRQKFIKDAIRAAMGKPGKVVWLYGMRLRYFSPGCQPKEGLLGGIDSPDSRWHNVICYSRPLTEEEILDYELDDLN